ncbi:zinc metalloprotease HtpX [Candidatus Woesearchaeota archaeon]|nr:zinc metalloprotease HtpX [Candidatus Woesearchaeota archaeon]
MGYFTNTAKTAVLLALLTALVLWIGQFFGGYTGLAIALVFVLVFNGAMYWWSDKIVLWMYKAKEAPKGHEVIPVVREVAHKAGIPMPKVYLVESATPNAFATGRSPSHSAVAVTSGIMSLLSEEELKGVIAHEVSHIKNRDTLIQTVAGVLAGVISYAASMARWTALFGGFGGRDDNGGAGNLISLLVIGILAPLIALILQLAISRTREYLADASAAKMIHTGKPLASALRKLDSANKSHPMQADSSHAATSSLFIVNPFKRSFLFEMFSTHPPIEKRIARLEKA